MNELTLNVKQNPGVIELNFDEIEKALDAKLAEYKGAVFTEESKSIAKSEVANLRKLKKDFEDARKGVKKEWMKPYEDFEAKMKNLTEKIDEPICLIDSQLKDFERKRREERREKIKEIYQEIIGDMEEYCDLGRIYDTKWENATTTMRSIRESIATAVESARIAVQVEIISDYKTGGTDWEQCCADYGTETGRSKLPVSEGWRTVAELPNRGRRKWAD